MKIYLKNKDSYVSYCYEIYKSVNKWQNKKKILFILLAFFKTKHMWMCFLWVMLGNVMVRIAQ